MAVIDTLAALAAIVVSIISGAISVNSVVQNIENADVKTKIQNLVNTFNNEVKSNRLNVNKLIALLQTRSSQAMMNYLNNNPVISKTLTNVQKDSEFISNLQTEQQNLENQITAIQSELSSLGYQSSHGGSRKESELVDEKEEELNKLNKKYEQLGMRINDEVKNYSTVVESKPIDHDLVAASQNLKGGLK